MISFINQVQETRRARNPQPSNACPITIDPSTLFAVNARPVRSSSSNSKANPQMFLCPHTGMVMRKNVFISLSRNA